MQEHEFRTLFLGEQSSWFESMKAMLTKAQDPAFHLEPAQSLQECLQHLAQTNWDVVLLDLDFPDSKGLHWVMELQSKYPAIPLVALVVRANEALGKQAVHTGAFDCLLKETLTPEMLQRALRYAVTYNQAQDAFLQSEHRHRELFENAKDILFTLDEDGNITSFNRSGERALGYARAEAIGMNIKNFVAPEHVEWCSRLTECAMQEDPLPACEINLLHKSGRHVLLEVTSLALYRGGKKAGVQGIARDITERRQLENKLRQSQKMHAIGRLSAGLAHDLNNVFCVIKGHTDLIADQFEPAHPAARSVEQINKSVDGATSLLRQLGAFSQQQVFRPQDLNLNDTVLNVKKLLSRLIGEQIKIVTTLDSNVGCVHVDPAQVVQILVNLALNAQDAMTKGGIITIETYNVNLEENWQSRQSCIPAGRYVLLAFSDSGVGMDAKTQAQVFEPYYTTKEFGKGMGLGLTTIYGIVKQSGGFIWVYSEPHHGTTFKIYLPRIDKCMTPAPSVDGRLRASGGAETVLLVEDEAPLRQLVSFLLNEDGYTVLEAKNGADAIDVAREAGKQIALLLTDVVMPEMGGRELAEKLSAVLPAMKVLYMSGYPYDGILQSGVLFSGMNLLEKPFTREGLLRRVREVLDSPSDPKREDTSRQLRSC